MMNNQIPIEFLITNNFVKYDRLPSIVKEAFYGSTAEHLNIYIDMYSIIKSLYSDNGNTILISEYRCLSSFIINMCAHYREWFRRSLGVSTKFFIVFSNNCNEINRKFCSSYNYKMLDKINTQSKTTEFINHNIELLNSLCPYLPDIHFIPSEYEVSVVIAHLINRELVVSGNNNPNMIISKDPYTLQLPTIYPDSTVILRPLKDGKEDHSIILNLNMNNDNNILNFWNYYSKIRTIKQDTMLRIHPCNISLLMALSKCPERNLKSIINIETAKKYIEKCVGNNPIRCSIDTLYDVNKDLELKIPRAILEGRYKAIDVLFQLQFYNDSTESKLINYKNLNDPDAVKAINDKYFTINPLDLERL